MTNKPKRRKPPSPAIKRHPPGRDPNVVNTVNVEKLSRKGLELLGRCDALTEWSSKLHLAWLSARGAQRKAILRGVWNELSSASLAAFLRLIDQAKKDGAFTAQPRRNGGEH